MTPNCKEEHILKPIFNTNVQGFKFQQLLINDLATSKMENKLNVVYKSQQISCFVVVPD